MFPSVCRRRALGRWRWLLNKFVDYKGAETIKRAQTLVLFRADDGGAGADEVPLAILWLLTDCFLKPKMQFGCRVHRTANPFDDQLRFDELPLHVELDVTTATLPCVRPAYAEMRVQTLDELGVAALDRCPSWALYEVEYEINCTRPDLLGMVVKGIGEKFVPAVKMVLKRDDATLSAAASGFLDVADPFEMLTLMDAADDDAGAAGAGVNPIALARQGRWRWRGRRW